MTDKLIKEKAAQKVVERDNMAKRWKAARFFNKTYMEENSHSPPLSLNDISDCYDLIVLLMSKGDSEDEISDKLGKFIFGGFIQNKC